MQRAIEQEAINSAWTGFAEAWQEPSSELLQALPTPQELGFLPRSRVPRRTDGSGYCEVLLHLLAVPRFQAFETGRHLVRIGDYVRLIANWLQLPPADGELLAAAAPLHDLGKLAVPEEILLKPGPLAAGEWVVMKRHPALGARLLARASSPLLRLARVINLSHHESWDGSGYPAGLKEERIPLAGRIVMLADRYDALRSARPYKPAFDHATACAVILAGDGRSRPQHFDPRLLALFERHRHQFDAVWRRWEEDARDR